jgi:hypothetical protein
VSFFGSMVTFVAVPYQVFRLTGSSLAVGLLGVVQMAATAAALPAFWSYDARAPVDG